MGFFNRKKKEQEIGIVTYEGKEIKDQRDVDNPTLKFHSRPQSASLRYSKEVRSNVEFFKPEYDLPTIANAIVLDGILRRFVNVYVEQILRNGFEFISRDDAIQLHCTRRLTEIERLTGVSIFETISDIGRQLVSYGNAYLVKVRSGVKSSYGKPYRLYGKNMNPIVGLFAAEATTMRFGLNDVGALVNYEQMTRDGRTIYWDERDVIHFSYNKIPGTLAGMSTIISVLDDVRALRKLEEEMEILGFQYSIPLYLYKVGTKDQPAAPGEVDQVTSSVNNMPSYGMLVVPGHHTIEIPANANSPVDIIAFVEHFKKRVYTGLGVSPVAMGEVETSNRNTSEISDSTMQSITKAYQMILKAKIEIELLREIMLDGNFTDLEQKLEISFPEIDLEQQIKKENAIVQLWENSLITDEEARMALDYERAYDQSRTYLKLVQIPLAMSKTLASSTSQQNSTANKNRPVNQHGRTSGRPKVVKNFMDEVELDNTQLTFKLLSDGGVESNLNRNTYLAKIKEEFKEKIAQQIDYTVNRVTKEFHLKNVNVNSSDYSDFVESCLIILEDKFTRILRYPNEDRVQILQQEMNDLLGIVKDKIFNLSKMLVYKSLGYMTILIDAEACDHAICNIASDAITYENIPPFNYKCGCSVDEKGFYEFDAKIDRN